MTFFAGMNVAFAPLRVLCSEGPKRVFRRAGRWVTNLDAVRHLSDSISLR